MNTVAYTVTRKLIVIGAPGGVYNEYLVGVGPDMRNVQEFFSAPNGGRWEKDECIHIPNAKVQEVLKVIKENEADYLIVYFSGHGYTDGQTGARMLCLQDGEISDIQLLNNSPRQLVLADTCRNVYVPAISGLPEYGETHYNVDGGDIVREIFDDFILKSPHGKMIIYGTREGYYSNDTPTGGCFTQALLYSTSKTNVKGGYAPVYLGNILEYTKSLLKKCGTDQIPTVAFKSGNLSIPFALSIAKRITFLPKQKNNVVRLTKREMGGVAAIGILVVLILYND